MNLLGLVLFVLNMCESILLDVGIYMIEGL